LIKFAQGLPSLETVFDEGMLCSFQCPKSSRLIPHENKEKILDENKLNWGSLLFDSEKKKKSLKKCL